MSAFALCAKRTGNSPKGLLCLYRVYVIIELEFSLTRGAVARYFDSPGLPVDCGQPPMVLEGGVAKVGISAECRLVRLRYGTYLRLRTQGDNGARDGAVGCGLALRQGQPGRAQVWLAMREKQKV